VIPTRSVMSRIRVRGSCATANRTNPWLVKNVHVVCDGSVGSVGLAMAG
jgi:hypothetical protein